MDKKASANDQKPGLSSAKREDIWAIIIAAVVMAVSALAPEMIYTFFKKTLYFL
jgi:hypothetical protein